MGFFQNTCKPEGFTGKLMVRMMNNGHSKLAKWGMEQIEIKKNSEILDIGCGGGANICQWLKLNETNHVTGIDYSEVSVNSSISKNKKAIEENRCEVLLGNVLEMPFEDNTFNAISAFETIYFWPEIESAFAEVYRVLKNGGKFMICNESDGENPKDEKWTNIIEGMTIYSGEKISELLVKVGFKNLKVKHTENHWICIIGEK